MGINRIIVREMRMMRRIWLETYRIQNKFTPLQIADKVEITRQYYGMIEKGERNPSVSIAKKIAAEINFKWTLYFHEEE